MNRLAGSIVLAALACSPAAASPAAVARIEQLAAEAARNRISAPDRFEVDTVRVLDEPGSAAWAEARVTEISAPNRAGIFRVRVGTGSGGSATPSSTVRVTVRGRRVGPVLVARHALPAGDPIAADAVTIEQRELDRLSCNPLRDASGMGDQVARRTLARGRVLCDRDLEPAPVVFRGEMVELEYRRRGLTIRTDVRALEDAAPGEKVRLIRPDTGQRLVGRVDANGRVSLGPGSR